MLLTTLAQRSIVRVMQTPAGEPRLVEVAHGVHAYLQKGSWGFSNAGLISDGKRSLLVDTLYDLRLTQQMLDTMRSALPAAKRIETLVNTHANGDHCWGNQLVDGAEIVSSRATAEEMLELKPALMRFLLRSATGISHLGERSQSLLRMLGRLGVPRIGPLTEGADFVQECFGAFDFRGIELTPPTKTFENKLTLTLGDKVVELIEVGPAHTKGDLVVYLPNERVVFTGDILFIESHPIVWEGPVSNWIAACDKLLALDADVVVPGHGPLTTRAGVQQIKTYWEDIMAAARRGYAAGASAHDVAREFLAENYVDWGESHRAVVNIATVYRELAADTSHRDPLDMFALMARLERARSRT
jgi:cyclase